jgi:hypothetical protein
LSNLTSNICSAMATDAATAAWCTTNYQQAQTVALGVDYDNLPPEEEYPIIMVQPISGTSGKNVERESAVYVLTCAIIDDANPTKTGRLKAYPQMADLDTFCSLALSAIEGADLLGGYIEMVETDNDPLEMFPVFSANLTVTISYPAPMRSRWAK